MYDRKIADNLEKARSDTPVVLLSGPRQVGKSTLALRAAQTAPGFPITLNGNFERTVTATTSRYFTLDDATTFAAIAEDPQGWLQNYRSSDWTVIDEVQRLPNLLIAIKREVDLDRRPNRFLLTGSADVMTIPHTGESLAGRVELLHMWPLSQTEIESTESSVLKKTFSNEPLSWNVGDRRDAIVERALRGGYPDAVKRADRARRNAWFGSYVMTVIQREIKSISSIEDNGSILRILRALASRSGQPKNVQSLSRDTGIPASTISRHIELLKATFLVTEISPWSGGVDARITRSPKLLINDSGLYGYLLNISPKDDHVGLLIENFVGTELLKLASYEGIGDYTLLHFRTREQQEVDFAIEAADRRIVGFEVKAATSVGAADFRGLKALRDIAGQRFHRGIVFYCGAQCVPFGPQLWAVPIGALWR